MFSGHSSRLELKMKIVSDTTKKKRETRKNNIKAKPRRDKLN